MSLQIAILKVLAGHPDGRATLGDLNRYLRILTFSGKEWADRTRRLAARVPGLDIFGQKLVLRDEAGWQLTNAGWVLLQTIDDPPYQPLIEVAVAIEPAPATVLQSLSLDLTRVHSARSGNEEGSLAANKLPSVLAA